MKSRFALLVAVIGLAGSSYAEAQNHATRAVPPTIPTVALDNVARHGIFFVGGKYVGELGPTKESTMGLSRSSSCPHALHSAACASNSAASLGDRPT